MRDNIIVLMSKIGQIKVKRQYGRRSLEYIQWLINWLVVVVDCVYIGAKRTPNSHPTLKVKAISNFYRMFLHIDKVRTYFISVFA